MRPTLLIVDDEPVNLRLLGGVLKADYQVKVATNGERALAIARELQPNLILLDISMPGMDGLEVCRRLKRDPTTQTIPVVFVTALSETGDEVAGLELGAADYIAKPFAPEVVRVRVKAHLELQRKNALLERLVSIDALTEIPNRRALESRVVEEWGRARREQQALGIAMIDVDQFKAFNDRCGHGAGDDCLRRIAKGLQSALRRPADFVARYGGEEFIALLPGNDGAGLFGAGERLRAGVETLGIPHPGSAHGIVTVSVGMAALCPTDTVHWTQVVEWADSALYAAKSSGRNRVRVESVHDEMSQAG